jgi:hypothetical protein
MEAAIAFAIGFGVCLPVIIGWFSLQEKKVKLERDKIQAGAAMSSHELAEMRAMVERLSDRMAVIERLITDDDRRVSREIDKLKRDEPRTGP